MGQPAMQPASATGAADLRFESAKAASAQRSVTSVMAIDSMAVSASPPSNAPTSTRVSTRRVGGRTFVLRDSVWTDTRYRPTMPTTTIKPFSQAYFDLLDRLPELRAVFALGARVLVVGKDRAISLSDRGAAQLSPAELKSLVGAW
jgi:hypothetical protein